MAGFLLKADAPGRGEGVVEDGESGWMWRVSRYGGWGSLSRVKKGTFVTYVWLLCQIKDKECVMNPCFFLFSLQLFGKLKSS